MASCLLLIAQSMDARDYRPRRNWRPCLASLWLRCVSFLQMRNDFEVARLVRSERARSVVAWATNPEPDTVSQSVVPQFDRAQESTLVDRPEPIASCCADRGWNALVGCWRCRLTHLITHPPYAGSVTRTVTRRARSVSARSQNDVTVGVTVLLSGPGRLSRSRSAAPSDR